MSNPNSENDLAAIISFEGSETKLRHCLHALESWVPSIIIISSEKNKTLGHIAEEFRASICICHKIETDARWDIALNLTNNNWALLLRSNEIVTGQLRKTIVEKINKNKNTPCQYPLPLTVVFLKKRLKYLLDWHDAKPSCLVQLSKNNEIASQLPIEHEEFNGELIRYSEDTLVDCANEVINKAEERALQLAEVLPNLSFVSLLIRAVISSIKKFIKAYFLKKGFKEGFEGTVFSICSAHSELLGYLRYFEMHVRNGENLRNNLQSLKKILIIKLRDVGDNILCTPLIYNLKQHLPNVSISVLTWSYSMPVFEKNPAIDHLFGLPKNPPSQDIKILSNKLDSNNFDLVISTHSGRLSSMLLSKIKTRNRINNHYRGRNKHFTAITNESNYYRSAIERDLDCMRSLGLEPIDSKTKIFLTPEETRWARDKLQKKGFDLTKIIALVHPTAGATIKEWPIEQFDELLQKLNETENIQPLVLCTNEEFARIQCLSKNLPDLVILHELTLRQMMAIVKECDLVIDNDSSPVHIAAAFEVPRIVLFSQSIREIFCPYPENHQHYVFYNDVNCRECELARCEDRICLNFSPNEVFSKALEILNDSPKISDFKN
jgi:ADP-heptose:LPS heptosyltransferase